MKKTFFALCLLSVIRSYGQDPSVKSLKTDIDKSGATIPTDTFPGNWKRGGLFSLSLAEGSLSNWAAGGDNFSLALTTYINAYAYYQKGKNSWDNILNFNFGYVNTTSLGSRKNDDRIELISKYGYALNPVLNLTGLFNFRSQFFKGYSYAADSSGRSVKTLSSGFLAPAYILAGAGLDYHPFKGFSCFISPLTSRWTLVNDDSLSARGAYGVTPGKKIINAIGAYLSVNYAHGLNSIVSYTGRLDLFSNYKFHPQNIDVYLTNLFTAKLSSVLSASLDVDLIYEDAIKLFGPGHNAPGLQVKSLIGAGLLVKI